MRRCGVGCGRFHGGASKSFRILSQAASLSCGATPCRPVAVGGGLGRKMISLRGRQKVYLEDDFTCERFTSRAV